MQKIIVIGNVGQDPEMRYLPSGQAVTNFSLASNRRWTNREGERQEETTWFRVDTWGKLAETCNQYVTKGKQIYVEGRLHVRQYEDRNNEMRVSIEVTAETVQFLGGGGDSQQSGNQQQQRSQTREPQERQRAQDGDDDEWDVDDLPF